MKLGNCNYRRVPKLLTLNDLERRRVLELVLEFYINHLPKAHCFCAQPMERETAFA